jgi:Tfp pilus assembly protein PilX
LSLLRKQSAGFALIAAVVLLVVLATLGITVSRLSNTQQITSAEDGTGRNGMGLVSGAAKRFVRG